MMQDGVKFIFKTLIRVPIVIYVAFALLNLFAFCFAYFKMLGVSYVVQQSAVENKYLTTSNLKTIGDYVRSVDASSVFIEEANIVVGDSSLKHSTSNLTSDGKYTTAYNYAYTSNTANTTGTTFGTMAMSTKLADTKVGALVRKQYGNEVTVGVTYRFRTVWPFDYRRNTTSQKTGVGIGGYSEAARKSNMADRQNRGYSANTKATWTTMTLSRNCINIVYTVPGLKYYPDLTLT